jgi:hypothetical protein
MANLSNAAHSAHGGDYKNSRSAPDLQLIETDPVTAAGADPDFCDTLQVQPVHVGECWGVALLDLDNLSRRDTQAPEGGVDDQNGVGPLTPELVTIGKGGHDAAIALRSFDFLDGGPADGPRRMAN